MVGVVAGLECEIAQVRYGERARDGADSDAVSAMCGLPDQNFDLQQPTYRFQTRAAARTGWKTGKLWTRTGRARALPFEPPKTDERKSRRPCAVTAAFLAELQRASKPGRTLVRHESISSKSGLDAQHAVGRRAANDLVIALSRFERKPTADM